MNAHLFLPLSKKAFLKSSLGIFPDHFRKLICKGEGTFSTRMDGRWGQTQGLCKLRGKTKKGRSGIFYLPLCAGLRAVCSVHQVTTLHNWQVPNCGSLIWKAKRDRPVPRQRKTVHKYRNTSLAALKIRKMQIKAAERHHFSSLGLAIIQDFTKYSLDETVWISAVRHSCRVCKMV